MNNIKLFLLTTGTVPLIILEDLGKRSFSHLSECEITLEFTFEELFSSIDFKNHLDAGAFILKDEYGNTINSSDQMYQASMVPKAVKQVKVAGASGIPGHRAVIIDNDLVELFDYTNPAHYGRCIGISNNSAVAGGDVQIISDGQKLGGLTFIPGATYYAGGDGILTEIKPLTGNRQAVGFAIDNKSMIVRVNRSVKLA